MKEKDTETKEDNNMKETGTEKLSRKYTAKERYTETVQGRKYTMEEKNTGGDIMMKRNCGEEELRNTMTKRDDREEEVGDKMTKRDGGEEEVGDKMTKREDGEEEVGDEMTKRDTGEDHIFPPGTTGKTPHTIPQTPQKPHRATETGRGSLYRRRGEVKIGWGNSKVGPGVQSGEKSLAALTMPSLWFTWLALFTLTCAVGFVEANTEGVVLEESLPHFLEPIPNKTVVVGRDVILPCSVDNLKGFKVAWIFVETQTILTIHHTIITKNPRFSLARNDHKHWYLKITDVRPSDRGLYMCQVNSDPMMSQVGFLDVQVPPDIIDEESSSEVVVKEGQDVTLECRARGSPKPVISWKREDGGKIDGINLKVTDSEVLHIPSVSRLHMGAYLCIASNDVPPSVSKRILLQVQFQPVLWIPNQLVGVAQGMDVTLECHTEAFPKSINYWTDERGQMILSSGRFDTIVAENGYKSYMRLKIKNIQPEDYMAYSCYAKNSFGETNGRVKIYEMPRQFVGGREPDEKKREEKEEEEEEEEGQEEEEEVEVRGSNRPSEPRRENQTKRRKGKHEEDESGQKRTGFHSSFDPPSLRKLPSSAPSHSPLSHSPILVFALCLWCLTVLLVRV